MGKSDLAKQWRVGFAWPSALGDTADQLFDAQQTLALLRTTSCLPFGESNRIWDTPSPLRFENDVWDQQICYLL
jgi:hypothetical protein